MTGKPLDASESSPAEGKSAEQAPPMPNDGPHVIDAAIQMLERRREVGRQRYKTPLQVGNGRDFGRDADEEMADWMIYWAGYRIEHARKVFDLYKLIGIQQTEINALKSELAAMRSRVLSKEDNSGPQAIQS